MLRLLDAADINAEIGIREEGVAERGGVGEVQRDQQGEHREGNGEAEGAEAVVYVRWPDYGVGVGIPEEDVRL